jgi:hypothetical protein
MTYKFKLSRRLAASHPRRLFAFVALLGGLSACGASSPTSSDADGITDPVATPGWLTVQLNSPYQDDGAVQFRITGPAIDSIAPTTAFDGFGTVTSGIADVVVTGTVTSGNVARFRVADVNRSAQYSVSVVAAAQLSTWELRALTGQYAATVVR